MSGFDMTKYREMFLEEAEELFESADNVLLETETTGSLTDEEMGQLFRDVHTLKGSGASVELSWFAKFTHEVENMMDKLRNHEMTFTIPIATTLIDALDVMKEILDLDMEDAMTQEIFDEKTKDLLEDIKEHCLDEQKEPQETLSQGNINQKSSGQGISSQENISQKSSNQEINTNQNIFSKPYGIFNDDEQNNNSANVSGENENFGFFDEEPEPTKEIKKDEIQANQVTQPSQEIIPNKASTKTNIKTNTKAVNDHIKSKVSASNNIRVNLDKIDLLMNNVGDLVITNAMLTQFANSIEDTKISNSVVERLDLLERHIREMQDSIMSIRMVPMESIYSKFPKIVRDISKKLNKKVEFKHQGDNVEIDKAMIEGLTDPLMHIIRNSLDHGLETPEERLRVNKSEVGLIVISAEQANGQMVITIKDDGAGINTDKVVEKALKEGQIDNATLAAMNDNEKAMLIFGAGISTSEKVTDISGRGVGMDVVKTNITKLGGIIKLDTGLGIGTTITIMLPLTLAILDGLDIAVGDTKYILPLSSIIESLQPKKAMVKNIGDGSQDLLMLREEFIPVVRLYRLFDVEPKCTELIDGMLIVVQSGTTKIAIFIDEFLTQHQVVVKPLDKNFRAVEGIGAATVRGDGSIGLILDVLGIIEAQKMVEKNIFKAKVEAS